MIIANGFVLAVKLTDDWLKLTVWLQRLTHANLAAWFRNIRV